MSNLNLGLAVRRRRDDAELSRERLSYHSGVSVSTIARLELSGRVPSVAKMQRIAAALDTTMGALLDAPAEDVTV